MNATRALLTAHPHLPCKLLASLIMLGFVVTLGSSSLAAESDAERVVVSAQSSVAAITADRRSGRRYDLRHHVITVSNRGDRPIALIGLRVRNAEVSVTDGFLYSTAALSMDQGWSFEDPGEFYRLIAPGATIGLTVTRRAPDGEGSGTRHSNGPLELFFADGSSLSIQ